MRRHTSWHDTGQCELGPRLRVEIESIEVSCSAQKTQIKDTDCIVAIGRCLKHQARVETGMTTIRREALALCVVQFEHATQLRIDALGPTLDHHAVAALSVEAIAINIARFSIRPLIVLLSVTGSAVSTVSLAFDSVSSTWRPTTNARGEESP